MKSLQGCILPLLITVAAVCGGTSQACAQFAPDASGGFGMAAPYPPMGGWGTGPMPAAYDPAMSGYGPQHQAAAAHFQPPAELGPMMAAPTYVDGPAYQVPGESPYYQGPAAAEMGGEDIWCGDCGGFGCRGCLGTGLGRGLFRRAAAETLEFLLPYTDGGCCTQRWFDISADYMYLTREETANNIPIASEGILGPIVLSTNDLEFEDASGFRFAAAYQVAPGSSLEFNYFGTFNYADEARVASATNNLFSVFSDFGTNPFGGFQETDAASLQAISYSSTFDSFELNYRRRWVGPFCRFQGSWLGGVRHFILDEDFTYLTRTTLGSMDYLVSTYNAITGFQVGGDLWACLVPGVLVGAEAKVGIYGNAAQQDTVINATTIANPPLREEAEKDLATFIGEANFMAVYRLTPKWTLRSGYSVLLVDGVALASENFNTAPPFVAGARTIAVSDTGEVYYHGFTAGLEFLW